MKMIDTETGHEMVEVSGHDKKEYASKGVAGTGLGLGIAGTVLWLLSGGLGGGLFGNRAGLAGAAAIGAEGIAKKEDKEALINSVKGVIEQSQAGKDLLTQQLNYVKSSKNAIIAESNKKLELFKKFQIAASANPNLTYKEFYESINK